VTKAAASAVLFALTEISFLHNIMKEFFAMNETGIVYAFAKGSADSSRKQTISINGL